MTADYYIIDPTKNFTALVTTPVLLKDQPSVASLIMKNDPLIEQVGFVKLFSDHVSLRMAGGEFCGNATMSAACLWSYLSDSENTDIRADVSGADEPLYVNLEMTSVIPVSYSCSLVMPDPISVREISLLYRDKRYALTAVDLSGILHLVTETKFDKSTAESAIKLWCKELNPDAIGLMQLNYNKLTPLVYVPGADTLFWENSCASGTTAVGHYLARRDKLPVKREILQPGGALIVESTDNNRIKLTGHASIMCKKNLSI